jgi:putative ABC transport system ATP-binding protein
MSTALETKSVTKTYQVDDSTIIAVDEITLSINKGEFVSLVGPSGSGKTTMLAMLAGLLTPTKGSIIIDGYELGRMSEAQRARFRRDKIGFTFQANNLVPYLTVRENVELMLRLNNKFDRAGKTFANELLVELGLGDRLKSLPSQLSGGQQQRVAIARALIHNPDIVLADEPTSNLDTERAFQVVKTFAGLIHSRNLGGIMVTHDLRMCKYTDKVIKMRDGKISRIIADEQEIRAFANSQN